MWKKRMICMVLAVSVLAAAGCGDGAKEEIDSGHSTRQIQAKELTADAGMLIFQDYAEIPGMQPVQQFAYELLANHLEEENPVICAPSVYVALCMLANGAKGETKKEFQKVMGDDLSCLPEYIMHLLPQDQEGITLTVVNTAWIDKDFQAKEVWLGTVKSLFDASVYQADLDTDQTRKDINQWVSNHTNGMVEELLQQNLNEQARLALLDALYFQAEWQEPFQLGITRTGQFHLDDGSVKKVPVMYQLYSACDYLKDDTSEGVVLPYADSSYAFVAIKPTGKESIREWYAACSAKKLWKLLQNKERRGVDLELVKFQARYRGNLVESLKKMGISRAFDREQADFTKIGISKQGFSPYVSDILQEAVVEVAEEGTKAAAATIVEMSDGGGMADVVPVEFDRPFFYMIADMNTGLPVFTGIMDAP